MHIVKQGQLLSFLDWNRDHGREFSELKKIGELGRERYEKLVEDYANAVGISLGSREFHEMKSSTDFDALVRPIEANRGPVTINDGISSATLQKRYGMRSQDPNTKEPIGPFEIATRYEAIPNRVYLFMTELDKTLGTIVLSYVEEIGRLSADHLDIVAPLPEYRSQSEYELFAQMYWFRKCKAKRADIPFFLIYSSKGFVRIDNHQGHFDVYYLRQLFRALPDEFEQIEGPATQKQLDAIAKNLRSLSASPQATQPQPVKKIRIRWGWIVTLVSLGAGLSTILANFDRAKTTACGLLDRMGLEVCVGQEDQAGLN